MPAGRIVAVIGPNGSGKTTLLEVVLGMVPVSSGSVTVFGRPPGSANTTLGYVPQHYAEAAGEAIRVIDAVKLGITGHRWGFRRTSAAERRRVDDALAWVELTELANTRLADLSGGQRQRVAIAAALAAQPEMLLLDEPLAALDLRNQSEIAKLLARLNAEQGTTIAVVAHDLNPLLWMLDSAIYLLDGHARHAPVGDVIAPELLSRLYGTRVRVDQPSPVELTVRCG